MPSTALRAVAPSKVNLYLEIGSVRSDGYHDLTTVFQAIDLCDVLTFDHATAFSLDVSPELGIPVEQNLVYRAAHLLADEAGVKPNACIGVEKRIPHGAGLGGGSSDAAATLMALDRLWDLRTPADDLTALARTLGADVPFFLVGGTALFDGRGDVLVRVLRTVDARVALVKPDAPIPASEAYRAFDAAAPVEVSGPERVLEACERGDVSALAESLFNAFTPVASALVSDVSEAVAWVRSQGGVLGACLAGSGSAVFALCDSEESVGRVVSGARERGWWSCGAHTCSDGVRIEKAEEGP